MNEKIIKAKDYVIEVVQKPNVKYWIGGCLLGLLLLFLFYHWSNKPDPTTVMVDNMRAQIREEYKQRFDALDKKNQEIDEKVKDADRKASVALDSINRIKKERANVKPPKDMDERISRLNALGLTPTSIR